MPSGPAEAAQLASQSSGSTQLSNAVKPTRYVLNLNPSLRTKTFTGTVTITFVTNETTISIKLNSLDLAIHSTTINSSPSSTPLAIASTSINRGSETFKILLEHCVPADTRLSLTITFSGTLRTNGEGWGWFMPGACHRGDGFTSTSYDPMWARTVFPCFDEPRFKAIFELSLIVPVGVTALGNMPIKSSELIEPEFNRARGAYDKRKKIVEFEPTPPIAPHLVAWTVGQFDYLEIPPLDDEKVIIRAYVPQGIGYNVSHTRYALNLVRRTTVLLASLLRSVFPYPKLDLLLAPSYIKGMKSPGLLALSAGSLIISPETSAEAKHSATQPLIHDIAHVWFGNLVTPSRWDSFWWKEGLCEWVECEVRERFWGNAWRDWISDGLQIALALDSYSSHPLEMTIDGDEVKTPLADDITYKKGCAVLRMLECYLGKDLFIEGLRVFVQLNADGNASSDDLWKSMSHVSGADVGAFMKPWMKKPGLPLVTVEESGLSGKTRLAQSQFTYLNDESGEDEDNLLPLPLEIVATSGKGGDLLRTKYKILKIPSNFITINSGQAGFFRVAYSPTRLRTIIEEMRRGNLCVEDRIGLLSNAAALCFSGHLSMPTPQLLTLLLNFENEENFYVWRVIVQILDDINKWIMWEANATTTAFERFRKHLVQQCLYRKGQIKAEDDMEEQRFKSMMFENAGGDDKVFEAATLLFDRFVLSVETHINPNLRAEVFKLVLSRKGKKEFHELKSRLKDCTITERYDILSSLGYCQASGCIKTTIKLATTRESITKNEMTLILGPLCTHTRGATALWKYIRSGVWSQNPQLSVDRMTPISLLVFSCFSKREQAESMRKVLKGSDMENRLELKRVLEMIEAKARWLERDCDDMMEWMDRNGYGQHARTKPSAVRAELLQFVRESILTLLITWLRSYALEEGLPALSLCRIGLPTIIEFRLTPF